MIMPAFWIVPLALVTLLDGPAGPSGAAQSRPKEVRNSLGMRLVEIPGGSFDMGSTVGPGEAPVHRVSVRSFWMGVTEVTQAQWQAVMGNNPSHFKKGDLDAPVEMVSWDDAQAFVRKLNEREPGWRYRLPSEAEWEYACLAGTAKDPYGPAGGDRVDQGELGRHHAPGRPEATECLRALRHVRQRAGVDAGHLAFRLQGRTDRRERLGRRRHPLSHAPRGRLGSSRVLPARRPSRPLRRDSPPGIPRRGGPSMNLSLPEIRSLLSPSQIWAEDYYRSRPARWSCSSLAPPSGPPFARVSSSEWSRTPHERRHYSAVRRHDDDGCGWPACAEKA